MMLVNFTMVMLGFTKNVQPNLRLTKHPLKVGGCESYKTLFYICFVFKLRLSLLFQQLRKVTDS